MFKGIITQLKPITLTLFIFVMTVGTVFAQEGESSSTPSGLTTLILVLGVGAIGALLVVNWSQTSDNDE